MEDHLDMSNEVAALQRSLGRLEGKMDLLLSNMQSHLLEDTARFQIAADRIDRVETKNSNIEKKIWLATGALTFLYILINWSTGLVPFINKH